MDFLKKQSVSTWICAGVFLFTLVSLILFAVNSLVGYFSGVGSGAVVTFAILALLALAAIVVLAQFEFDGLIGKVIDVTVDVLKIIVPVFLMLCVLNFVSVRIEGLAYIFGSNEEILATIQTPVNLASAGMAIAGFVLFGIASVAGIVAAFFGFKKKEIV